MFNDLEKARQREKHRISPDAFNAVIVKTVDDIRKILAELDPARVITASDIKLKTQMLATEDGQNNTYEVSAITKSKNKREYLLEGLNLIKRQMAALGVSEDDTLEINGREVKPAKIGNTSKGCSLIDPMIKHWFGAYRDGLLICWNIDGYVYQYDVYEHKLARVQHEDK